MKNEDETNAEIQKEQAPIIRLSPDGYPYGVKAEDLIAFCEKHGIKIPEGFKKK